MSAAARETFPLVPRFRSAGRSFGRFVAVRRGQGSSVAGSRPYRPGDRLSSVDWKGSARLSAVRGDAEFIVREHLADDAPRLAVLADERPSMRLYAEPFPWLDKQAAVTAVWQLVAATAAAELGRAEQIARHEPTVEQALDELLHLRPALPQGAIVFVCSDFLEPPPTGVWRRALARRLDVVPVVIQDPTWEQSFPAIGPCVLPLADPATGAERRIRIGRGDAAARRGANERRLSDLLATLRGESLDPIVLGSAEPADVLAAFAAWADQRADARRAIW
jgi:uncharacterized protein (DUF58 family)